MFIQVIQGKVSDPAALLAGFREWVEEVAPSSPGWLGTTAGVTPDSEFVAVVRFESEAAARANEGRPEQTGWWERTRTLFTGEPGFHDYPQVALWMGGGSDDAGFVQLIQGTVEDREALAGMANQGEEVPGGRSDIIGGSYGWDETGHFTETVYFTSEEAAREGERTMDQDSETTQRMEEFFSKVEGLRYLDLPEPWMASP